MHRIQRHRENFVRLARVDKFEVVEALPQGGVQTVVDGATLILGLGEGGDLVKERERLGQEIAKLDGELARFVATLANANFLPNAKPAVGDQRCGGPGEGTR